MKTKKQKPIRTTAADRHREEFRIEVKHLSTPDLQSRLSHVTMMASEVVMEENELHAKLKELRMRRQFLDRQHEVLHSILSVRQN